MQLKQYRKQQLGRRLIEEINNQSQHRFSNNKQSNHRPNQLKVKQIKKYILIIGSFIFLFYKLFNDSDNNYCLLDRFQDFTSSINKELNFNPSFYNIYAILVQQIIELEFVFLSYLGIFKTQNLRIHLFVGLFYGIRASYLNFQKLPFPKGIVSYQPTFPSFTVPYGITRDFFYSGHTGLMVFTVMEAKRVKWIVLYYINLVCTIIVILFLVSTRVHYSIDIVGGMFFCLWIDKYLASKYLYFDILWTLFYNTGALLYEKIKKILFSSRSQ